MKKDHFPVALSTAKCQNSYRRNFRVNVFTPGLQKLQSRLAKKMIQFNIQFKTISRKVILNIIHSKHYKNCRSWQPRNTSVQNVNFKWQKCPVSPVCIPCKLEVVYKQVVGCTQKQVVGCMI